MKKEKKTAGKTALASTSKKTSAKKREPVVTPLTFTPEQIAEGEKIHERLCSGERVPYREFIKSCRADFYMQDINRDVDERKVEDIAGDILQNKACWKDIVLFDAPTIWKYGHKLYRRNEKGESVEVTDKLEGAKVCAYSPGDGQHRNAAALKLLNELGEEEFAKIDIYVLLETREIDPAKYISSVNIHQFGWNAQQKRSVVEKRFSSPTLDFTKKVTAKPFRMSLRAAFKLIYLSEVYKKAIYDDSLQKGKLDSKLEATPDKLERAERLLKSLSIAFQAEMGLLRNSAAVDCIVNIYTDEADDKKTDVVDSLNAFFRTLPKTVIDQLKAEKVVANRTQILQNHFDAFKVDYATAAGKSMYDAKAAKATADYEANI